MNKDLNNCAYVVFHSPERSVIGVCDSFDSSEALIKRHIDNKWLSQYKNLEFIKFERWGEDHLPSFCREYVATYRNNDADEEEYYCCWFAIEQLEVNKSRYFKE